MIRTAIISGSLTGGRSLMDILTDTGDIRVIEHAEVGALMTPFGMPSGNPMRLRVMDMETGELREVICLNRHGPGHLLPPHRIPYAANAFFLRMLGVTRVVCLYTVGSLTGDYRPGDIVILKDVMDRTNGRSRGTFFDDLAMHVSHADPFCVHLRNYASAMFIKPRELLFDTVVDTIRRMEHARGNGTGTPHNRAQRGGIVACIPGPGFSSRGESAALQNAGANLVGMPAVPEAKLLREAGLPAVGMAYVSDYDCAAGHEAVTADMVMRNAEAGRPIMAAAALHYATNARADGPCACETATHTGLMTHPDAIPAETLLQLYPLLRDHPRLQERYEALEAGVRRTDAEGSDGEETPASAAPADA